MRPSDRVRQYMINHPTDAAEDSDREIARLLQVSNNTVSRVRRAIRNPQAPKIKKSKLDLILDKLDTIENLLTQKAGVEMTPERLREIEGFIADGVFGLGIIEELIVFARATLDSKPKPCSHTYIYQVCHVSDQIITMCQGCGQVLRVEERKGQEWVMVIDNRASGAIPQPKPNCPKCGNPCEVCSK